MEKSASSDDDDVVARAQALSKAMLEGADDMDVDAFVAERHADADHEP